METRKNNKKLISDLQERINSKFKDCIDPQYLLDIKSDIAFGVTIEEIEECLKNNDNCSHFRNCIEGKRQKI